MLHVVHTNVLVLDLGEALEFLGFEDGRSSGSSSTRVGLESGGRPVGVEPVGKKKKEEERSGLCGGRDQNEESSVPSFQFVSLRNIRVRVDGTLPSHAQSPPTEISHFSSLESVNIVVTVDPILGRLSPKRHANFVSRLVANSQLAFLELLLSRFGRNFTEGSVVLDDTENVASRILLDISESGEFDKVEFDLGGTFLIFALGVSKRAKVSFD